MDLNNIMEEMKLSDEDKKYILSKKEYIDDTTKNLWKTVADASSYLFNASHSVCVSLDSLYTAYVKAHYPLEFYEVVLEMASNDKDTAKVALLKNEAFRYKGIEVVPLQFGQDNTKFTSDKEKNVIYQSMLSVKDINDNTANILKELGKNKYDNFYDLYLDMKEEHRISKTHISNLCKIGYFTNIEPSKRKALWLSESFNAINKKTLKKDKVDEWYKELNLSCGIMKFYNKLKELCLKDTPKQLSFEKGVLPKFIYSLVDIKDNDKMEEYTWEAHLTGTTIDDIDNTVLMGRVVKYNPSYHNIVFKHIKSGEERYIKLNCNTRIKEKDLVFIKSITTKKYKGRVYITAEKIENLTNKYLK